MSRRPIALALAAAVLWPAAAAAQDWRTVASRRDHTGEDALRVKLEYGVGELRVEPAAAGSLYRTSIRYDAEVFEPKSSYRDGQLMLGIKNIRARTNTTRAGNRLELGLGPGVPVSLDLTFGAVEADLELGGLRLREARIATGASDTRLHFSQPNPDVLRSLRLEVGAAAFQASGLGNANATRIEVHGGVGDIQLDFSGAWRQDMDAEINMGLGSLTLTLPRGLGVRVRKATVLVAFDSQELIKRGDAYYSESWDRAAHRLTLDINGAFSAVNVRWVEPDAGSTP